MNNKETELYRIMDSVISCCAMMVDESGKMSVTREDVVGVSRAENIVMTRAILVGQIIGAGYSLDTAAMLIRKTTKCVRHLLALGLHYHQYSRAYRIAEAEATLLCKDIGSGV